MDLRGITAILFLAIINTIGKSTHRKSRRRVDKVGPKALRVQRVADLLCPFDELYTTQTALTVLISPDTASKNFSGRKKTEDKQKHILPKKVWNHDRVKLSNTHTHTPTISLCVF